MTLPIPELIDREWVRKPYLTTTENGLEFCFLGWWLCRFSRKDGTEFESLSFERTETRYNCDDVREWCDLNGVFYRRCTWNDEQIRGSIPLRGPEDITIFDLSDPDHDFAFKLRWG